MPLGHLFNPPCSSGIYLYQLPEEVHLFNHDGNWFSTPSFEDLFTFQDFKNGQLTRVRHNEIFKVLWLKN